MRPHKPAILLTGVSGNLGMRLLPLLADFKVIGIDMKPPLDTSGGFVFESIDLGMESSCRRLVELIREHNVWAVVHLAFVIDPQRTGVLDKKRMWQINVAGTGRVMEAIAECNRNGSAVERLIIPSSVSVYGPETPPDVGEDHRLGAQSLTYALHKQAADEVVQLRSGSLGACTTILLRPHIFVGHSVENYLVGALRGTPTGSGDWGAKLRYRGTRLPLM